MNQHEIAKIAAVARHYGSTTLKGIREALKSAGHKQGYAKAVQEEALRQEARHKRPEWRWLEKAARHIPQLVLPEREEGYDLTWVSLTSRWLKTKDSGQFLWATRKATRIVTLDMTRGSLAERLERLRKATIIRHWRSIMTVPTSAEHGQETVTLTRQRSEVGVKQERHKDWNVYKGKYKGWAAQVTDTTITVMEDWRRTVLQHSLAHLGGLFTLFAAPLDGPSDMETYEAIWARQDRGYHIAVEHGYIVHPRGRPDLAFHDTIIWKAIAGASLKAEEDLNTALPLDDVMARLTFDPTTAPITLADARNAGACESGIMAWCDRTGLPYDEGRTTLSRAYEAYQHHPVREARAAILHAIRRHQSAALHKAA